MSFIVSLTGLSLLQGPELFVFTYLVICKQNAIVVVQLPSHVRRFGTPWTTAHQASLSLTISWSLPKFVSITSVMPSSHLIFWCPLLLSVFPSIRDFSNESAVLIIRWQNTGTSSWASILPMSVQGWFLLRLTGLISSLSKGLWGVFSSTTVQRHQFFGTLPSLWSSFHSHTWLLEKLGLKCLISMTLSL